MFITYLGIPVLWTIGIVILYGVPPDEIPNSGVSIDKAVHLVMFMVMVHTWAVYYRKQLIKERLRNNALKIALIQSAIAATFLELTQGMIFVGRTTDYRDLIANLIGCLCGLALFRLIYGKELTYNV